MTLLDFTIGVAVGYALRHFSPPIIARLAVHKRGRWHGPSS